MLFELPELDIPSARELVEEARTGISGLNPLWTDHNPSDPGITLLELLAWLTEMVLYRAGRLRDGHLEAFLVLLGGTRTQRPLDEALRQKVLELREPWLAVTERDFEFLVLKEFQGTIRRARCLGQRNLEDAPNAEAAGHVSLILLPVPEGAFPPPVSGNVLQAVRKFLEPRRLLTTQVHVMGWRPLRFTLKATLHLTPDVQRRGKKVEDEARKALLGWLHPLSGGQDGRGWPFGRGIQGSEIYALLERVPGVDFITGVQFSLPAGTANLARVQEGKDDSEPPALVLLHPAALPRLEEADIQLTTEVARGG